MSDNSPTSTLNWFPATHSSFVAFPVLLSIQVALLLERLKPGIMSPAHQHNLYWPPAAVIAMLPHVANCPLPLMEDRLEIADIRVGALVVSPQVSRIMYESRLVKWLPVSPSTAQDRPVTQVRC